MADMERVVTASRFSVAVVRVGNKKTIRFFNQGVGMFSSFFTAQSPAPVAPVVQADAPVRSTLTGFTGFVTAQQPAPVVPAVQESTAQDQAKRVAMLNKFSVMKPFNGWVTVPNPLRRLPITNGSLRLGSEVYAVAKDGRAVMNRSRVIVGQIVAGRMQKPSAAFIEEMKILGAAR